MSRTILESDIATKLQRLEDRSRALEEGLRAQSLQGLTALRELPKSPTLGQVVKLQLLPDTSTAPGVFCFMQYRPESQSTYKWEYIGGFPVRLFTNPYTVTNLPGSFTSIAVNGSPTYTLPFTGEWNSEFQIALNVATAATFNLQTDRVGGGSVVESTAGYGQLPAGETKQQGSSRMLFNANDTVRMTLACSGSAQNVNVYYSQFQLYPVRLLG